MIETINENFFFIIILIFLYLTLTFFISFKNISKYVSENNYNQLGKYILEKKLKKNIHKDLKEYINNNLDKLSKSFEIKDDNFEISGTFSNSFILNIFYKTIESISSDFSNSKIMLYFYENSNEIDIYFNKYLSNLGDYSFQTYLNEISIEDNESNDKATENPSIQTTQEEDVNKQKDKKSILIKINRLINKLKATDYFFFISPIHFKLSVTHQDFPFVVIFKFNGYYWKISNLNIGYEKIINL